MNEECTICGRLVPHQEAYRVSLALGKLHTLRLIVDIDLVVCSRECAVKALAPILDFPNVPAGKHV